MSNSIEMVLRVEVLEGSLNLSEVFFQKLSELSTVNLDECILSSHLGCTSGYDYIVYAIDDDCYGGDMSIDEKISQLIEKYGINYHVGCCVYSDYGFEYYTEYLKGKRIKNINHGTVLPYVGALTQETYLSMTNFLNFNIEDRSNSSFFNSKQYTKVEEILSAYEIIDLEDVENIIGGSEYLDYETKTRFIRDLNKVLEIIKPFGLSLSYSLYSFDKSMNLEQITMVDGIFEYRNSMFSGYELSQY